MKCIKNTLEMNEEVWDDPGDYPNSTAAYPLRSYAYVSSRGELVFEFEDESIDDFINYFDDFIYSEYAREIGAKVATPYTWNVDWKFDVNGKVVTVTVGENSKQNFWD